MCMGHPLADETERGHDIADMLTGLFAISGFFRKEPQGVFLECCSQFSKQFSVYFTGEFSRKIHDSNV